MQAVRARERGEIGVAQLSAADASRIMSFLMHAYRAIHAVIDDDENDFGTVLRRCRKLLTAHEEVAVTRKRHDWTFGMHEFGGDSRRHAVPHRAARRPDLGAQSRVLVETVHPQREIAGAVSNYGFRRQPFAEVV